MRRNQGTLRPIAPLDLERSPDLKPVVDAWYQEPIERLTDLENGPLALVAGDLVIVESDGRGDFFYHHYGERVSQASGLDMQGKTTADFDSSVGDFFSYCYRETLLQKTPIYAVHKANKTHHTHSWERLLLPIPPGNGFVQPRVLAFVRPVALVADVLADFSRDIGFLGGTLEPVLDDGILVDFAILSLSDPVDVFGLHRMDRLTNLFGRPLTIEEIRAIQYTPDGITALSCEVPDSMDRFGRTFQLKVIGDASQPVFSLTDATEFIVARETADAHKEAMADFARTASDWMWESDTEHRMTMITEAVEIATGFPPSHYVGKSRFAFANHPENAMVFEAHRKQVDAHKPFRGLVYKTKGADAKDRWLRVNGVPRFDQDGAFLGYRGTGSNITAEVKAKRALEERKAAMEDFAKVASDWMWETDVNHAFTFMSTAICDQTGADPDRYIGVNWFELENEPENAEVFAEMRRAFEAHEPFANQVYKGFRENGDSMWVRASGKPRFSDAGVFLGYRGTSSNITAEIEAREQAARRAQELADAHRIGRLGAWSFNHHTKMVTLSPEYLELVGLSEKHAAMPLDEAMRFFSPESRIAVSRSFRKVLRTGGDDTIDVVWTSPCCSMDLNVTARARSDAKGRVYEVYGTVQDITERKQAERALETLAFHDPLTGLGNRSYFARELNAAMEHAANVGQNAGLLLLDLDHFKEVNDSLGHAAGDELLRRVAERLSMTVTGRGAVFRLGGDEFAAIVPNARSAAELDALASAIISAFAGTVRLNDGSVHISTSIGMVMLPEQTSDPDEGMRYADLALYEAKNVGRNRALLFHAGLDKDVRDRVNLAHDLRMAIKDDALDAHYQLQIDVSEGKVQGFEALARWNHPTRGPIPPSTFIPIAESSRLIADLGAWMVRHVCRQGRAWLDAGGAPLEMAVNLSVAQLWHSDVESDITSALEETGFPPELLCVELTETVFGNEAMPRIQRLFVALKNLGVQIALDDFGTGYSSLQYLNDLSFDKVKIDRSFISNCDRHPDKLRLLQGIIGLGKGLGLGIIVEGVENESELKVISDLGCEVVQGFFFAKPKPFHEACLDAAQIEADNGFNPVFWKDRQSQIKQTLAEKRRA